MSATESGTSSAVTTPVVGSRPSTAFSSRPNSAFARPSTASLRSSFGGGSPRGAPRFRPKTPRSQLDAAARVIQLIARRRLRQRLIQSIEQGQTKLYQQKHTRQMLDASATLIAKTVRGNQSRAAAEKELQDRLDEEAVDAYNRAKAHKHVVFKPKNPPSYYHAAAGFLQRRIKASLRVKHGEAPPLPQPQRPAFVPMHSQSEILRAVLTMQALQRGEWVRKRLTTQLGDGSRLLERRRRSSARRGSFGSSGSGSARASPPPAAAMAPPAPTPQELEEQRQMAARQEEAEDYFLLADTSGDGFVDEDELVVLCAQLLRAEGPSASEGLARYVQRFRTAPDAPLNLDFDAFVGVYNSLIQAQSSGELRTVLGGAAIDS